MLVFVCIQVYNVNGNKLFQNVLLNPPPLKINEKSYEYLIMYMYLSDDSVCLSSMIILRRNTQLHLIPVKLQLLDFKTAQPFCILQWNCRVYAYALFSLISNFG